MIRFDVSTCATMIEIDPYFDPFLAYLGKCNIACKIDV